jgi:hypothetical protein
MEGTMMSDTIAVVRVDALDDLRILVEFSDDSIKEIDLGSFMAGDDTFRTIREERQIFEQTWVNPETRGVEWFGEVSIDADVLHGSADPSSGARIESRTLREPRRPERNWVTPPLLDAVPGKDDYVVHLRFADGTEADVDLGYLRHFDGVFAPFRDPGFFRRFRVYDTNETIYWPNNADIAPETLYAHAKRGAEVGRSTT